MHLIIYISDQRCDLSRFETTKKDEYVLHVVDLLVDRVTWSDVWSVDQVTQQRRPVVESSRSISNLFVLGIIIHLVAFDVLR